MIEREPDRNPGTARAKFSAALIAAIVCTICLQEGARADQVVRLDTTKGPIFIRIFQSMVPNTANSFLDLVSRGFYQGTVFHRIESWCVQGGSPGGNPNAVFVDPQTGSPRFLPLEINRNLNHNSAGMVAMARSANNVNSSSCQFYILKQPMAQLNGKYNVFGKVVGGMNSVYAMRRGDQITGCSIVPPDNGGNSGAQSAGSSSAGNAQTASGNRTQGRSRSSGGGNVPYEPPAEIPDSGF